MSYSSSFLKFVDSLMVAEYYHGSGMVKNGRHKQSRYIYFTMEMNVATTLTLVQTLM